MTISEVSKKVSRLVSKMPSSLLIRVDRDLEEYQKNPNASNRELVQKSIEVACDHRFSDEKINQELLEVKEAFLSL